ncbi:hypothetical protein ABZ671_24265 [Micromonospora sp. NPDC006766]|uniref:hypothetical protein n=1 Tax=Micromonospora sp. NPDC006766 TaxID=3154778 RepID=UPI0033FDE786
MTEGETGMKPVAWAGAGMAGLYVVTTLFIATVASLHPDSEIRQDSRAVLDRLLSILPILAKSFAGFGRY